MLVQAREGPPGKNIVIYNYEKSRAANVIAPYIAGFKGAMVSDGLLVYQNLTSNNEHINHGGCLAPARRKFAEAVKGKRNRASVAKSTLEILKKIFKIEADIKGLSLDQIRGMRKNKSIPLMLEYRKLLDDNSSRIPAKSLTGKAIGYSLGQWEYLTRFLDDPRLPAHNNYVEQRIRKFVIGRKTWLRSKSGRCSR
ncbi:MAG: transposase [Pseudobacteriovorax sp.]|nr:transposase [Pseudobacteriovorax sp.]